MDDFYGMSITSGSLAVGLGCFRERTFRSRVPGRECRVGERNLEKVSGRGVRVFCGAKLHCAHPQRCIAFQFGLCFKAAETESDTV